MKVGDIVLIPFPFSSLTNVKLRPAVVICVTKDHFQDLTLCAISSVMPSHLNLNEIKLPPDSFNHLRKPSVLKVDRIVTLQSKNVTASLGELSPNHLVVFKATFKALVD